MYKRQLYEDGISFDDEIGRVTYQSVDMFYRKDKIAEVLRLGYEYYIYDFGIFDSVGFSLVSYLEKNLKIMVCGIKPNEASYMTDILASLYDKDIEYIFSFTHESDRKDILELMADRAEHTFFAPWIPEDVYKRQTLCSPKAGIIILWAPKGACSSKRVQSLTVSMFTAW